MRTQFLFVGLLSAVAGMLVGTAGCDNITAGQPTDSTAPPRLVHVLIQDARYLLGFPNRAQPVDLIPVTNPASCSDAQPIVPCLQSFLVDQVAPTTSCVNGLCTNPLAVPTTGVPLPRPAGAVDMRDPGGGVQVRLVFDKVLANGIETVVMDPTKAPGKNDTYTIEAGLLELDDEAGKEVPSVKYYDNGGSSSFSSDLELVPLGAALVIKPKAPLDDATTYTLKLTKAADIKDRQGNAAVNADGTALTTSFKFKTENLISVAQAFTPAIAGAFGPPPDFPAFIDGSDAPAAGSIAPNEVLQQNFYEAIAGDTATVTVVSGPTIKPPMLAPKPIAFSDRGADPTMCSISMDPGGFVLDIMNTDNGDVKTGVPVDWPPGDYVITVKVPSGSGKSTFTSPMLKFTVAAMCKAAGDCSSGVCTAGACADQSDPTMDGNIASTDVAGLAKAMAGHLLPSQCMMK